jgi:hypothetical protein
VFKLKLVVGYAEAIGINHALRDWEIVAVDLEVVAFCSSVEAKSEIRSFAECFKEVSAAISN